MTTLQELLSRSPGPVRFAAMNIYGLRQRRLRFGGDFERQYAWLAESQYLSRDELEAIRLSQLREVLEHASTHVPFYREIFRERGLTLDDFQELEDLTKLPILTKADLRDRSTSLVSELPGSGKVVHRSSSGTTGERVSFLVPHDLLTMNFAFLWRAHAWSGIPLGARRVTMTGRWFTRRAPYWSVNHAERQLVMSIHHLSPKTIDGYLEAIRTFKPEFIQSHPSGVYLLASRLLERGSTLPVPAIWTTGETLSPDQREDIETAFECSVFESYGQGESVVSAMQCGRGNAFHDNVEYGFTEFVRDDDSGLYSIVGTSLWNWAQPFVRYRIEDLVELADSEQCECGRTLPLTIKRIIGRIDDVLTDTQGDYILPYTLRTTVKPLLDNGETYQLQQLGDRDYALLCTGLVTDSRKHSIEERLRPVLGADSRLVVRCVGGLQTKGGKVRNVVDLRSAG